MQEPDQGITKFWIKTGKGVLQQMRKVIVGILVIGLAIGLGAYGLVVADGVGSAQEASSLQNQAKPTTITVLGWGESQGAPDVAKVTLGVETEGASAVEAQNKNNQVMEQVITALRDLGIPQKNIKTEYFYLYPERRYDPGTSQQELVGYRANNEVVVTITDTDGLGAVIDAAIMAGANRVNSVEYDIQRSESVRDAALQAAVADATHKAQVLAQAAGVKIVELVSLKESGTAPYHNVTYAKADALGDTPLQPGQVSVKVGVEMVFAVQ